MTDSQYIKCAHFLHRVKIIHGNDFLNSTLRRHAKLRDALQSYEQSHIIELEREILKSDGVQ